MKTQLRLAALSAVTALCLIAVVLPASAGTLYDNGPLNGNTNAWTVSRDVTGFTYNYYVSNSFSLASTGGPFNVTGFDFYAWVIPGDNVNKVSWEFSNSAFNGSLGLGTACNTGGLCNGTVSNHYEATNFYGYNLDFVQVSGITTDGPMPGGQYYLTLESSTNNTAGDPVYWDENSGVGCLGNNGTGGGCGSSAANNDGTIPSEAFTIEGTGTPGGTTPEPSSLVLLGSGVLGLAGVGRRKLSL